MSTTMSIDINEAYSQYEEWLSQGNEKAKEMMAEYENEAAPE